ncbi:MAG TPA: isoprenylcysteine carboxylmethyltransferase family protein [Thermoanaerobaculia bacterium]
MSEILARFTALPGYGIAALIVLLLYAAQAEIRFGSRARSSRPGPADRKSTLAVSASSAVPILGFVLAMKVHSPSVAAFLPSWFRAAVMPWMPLTAWVGVVLAASGVALRMWAVLQLRHRYTRTLLIQDQHSVERGGPYRWVRHPGYLGSLLCLNGVAVASGNWMVFVASMIATSAAYAYRIKVEDEMLSAAFGPSYDEYRRRVPALIP